MNATSPFLLYDTLPQGVLAFSTTRHGGVSTGPYATMNCTPYTGDNPDHVLRNRQRLWQCLPQQPKEVILPCQTHGTAVCNVDEAFLHAPLPQRQALLQGIDALITCHEGVCLCIATADCIPVLLYDAHRHVIAAIHAGWRGTVAHIAGLTLQHMQRLYATDSADVHAIIGPGISREAYEVGGEVYEAFRQAGFPMHLIASGPTATGKYHLDLPLTNRLELIRAGLPDTQIKTTHLCTYTRCNDFFSARRLGIRSGRILNGIMLTTPPAPTEQA